MKNHNRTQFLKQLALLFFGAVFVGVLYAQLDIPTNINNAVQTIQTIVVTDNGRSDGNKVMILNSGGTASALQVSGSVVAGRSIGSNPTLLNKILGEFSSILAGFMNKISGANSTILGGNTNTLTGDNSVILGGENNKVNGAYSTAGGTNTQANHPYTWVWSDDDMSYVTPFASTKSNTFIIRALNGVGINTNNPTTTLEVNGTIGATQYCDINGANCVFPNQIITGAKIGPDIIFSGGLGFDSRILGKVGDANSAIGRWVKFVTVTMTNYYQNNRYEYYIKSRSFAGTLFTHFSSAATPDASSVPLFRFDVDYNLGSPLRFAYYKNTATTYDIYVYMPSYTSAYYALLYNNLAGNGRTVGTVAYVGTYIDPPVGYTESAYTLSYLPTASTGQTLRHNGSTWLANSTIYNNGTNVGIGTTNPSRTLQVQKTGTGPALMIGGGFAGSPRIQTYGLDADGNAWMGLGTDMAGGSYEHSLYYPTVGFQTIGTYNGTTYSEKMRVTSGGNVGIGITTPSAKLDVGANAGEYAYNVVNKAETPFSLYLKNLGSNGGNTEMFKLGLRYNADLNNGFISFYRGTSTAGGFLTFGSNGTERMRIDPAGNVGIGATTPAYKLQVQGNASFANGNLIVNNNGAINSPSFTTFPAQNGNHWGGLSVGIHGYSIYEDGDGKDPTGNGFMFGKVGSEPLMKLYPNRVNFVAGISSPGFVTNGYGVLAPGDGSTALGNTTIANGFGSFAGGYQSIANGTDSFAFGNGAIAQGSHSVSMGYHTISNDRQSVAFGSGTQANGPYSVAMGANTQANGSESFAIGINTIANEDGSIAGGFGSQANGKNTLAVGYTTLANGLGSFAGGYKSVANGVDSFSFGSETQANGDYSIAIGSKTQTARRYGVAMGQGSQANGHASVAMGVNTIANGVESTAMGSTTTANGEDSTSMGANTIANGNGSIAGGFGSIANGKNSLAIGNGVTTDFDGSLAIGSFNIPGLSALFQIGNGTSDSTSNVFTVLSNGNVGIGVSDPAYALDISGTISASTLMVDKLVNRTVTNITVSGQLLPDANASIASQTIGNTSTPWKALYAGGITALANGNVGIGTTPTQPLEVYKANTHDVVKVVASPGYRGYSVFQFGESQPRFYNIGSAIWFGPGNAVVDAGFARTSLGNLKVVGNNGGAGNLLVAGALGVGTTDTPTEKLEVVGNIKSTTKMQSPQYCDINGNNCMLPNSGYVTGSTLNNYVTTNTYNTLTASLSLDYVPKWNGTAMVNSTIIDRNGSISMGTSQANGSLSTAMGYQTQASGYASMAMGRETRANGYYSTAMGLSTQANAYATTAMGVSTQANGQYSTAMGVSTQANGQYSTVMGKYNLGLTNSLLEIGMGLGSSNKANALTVYDDGRVVAPISMQSPSFLGNATTATNLSTNRTNWNSNGTISAVVGQLAWENYGNGHTIFDASAGISPSGTSIDKSNPQNIWSSNYPTLMGWNGSNTYGVKVDRARLADTAYVATTADYATSAGTANYATSAGTANYATSAGTANYANAIAYNNTASGNNNAQFMQLSSANIAGDNPTNGWVSLIKMNHGNGDNYYNRTLAFDFFSEDIYTRRRQGGTANPWKKLVLSDTSNNINQAGTITAAGFYYSSDISLKKNIKSLDSALSKINKLNGYSFSWKSTDKKDIGVIAQEVEKVFPELVHTDDAGIKSVEYGNLVAPIIEAIKELSQKLENLFAKYVDQEARIDALEQRLQKLENK